MNLAYAAPRSLNVYQKPMLTCVKNGNDILSGNSGLSIDKKVRRSESLGTYVGTIIDDVTVPLEPGSSTSVWASPSNDGSNDGSNNSAGDNNSDNGSNNGANNGNNSMLLHPLSTRAVSLTIHQMATVRFLQPSPPP
jgi:hypothetical protein